MSARTPATRAAAVDAVERTRKTAHDHALALAATAERYACGRAPLGDLLAAARRATNAEHAASRARKRARDLLGGEDAPDDDDRAAGPPREDFHADG